MIYWFIHILILGFLSFVAFKQLQSPFKPIVFWSALTLKLVAGITLGFIFYYYYKTGDSITFFTGACELSNLSWSDHFKSLMADGSYATTNQPREVFFIKILSVFTRLTGNSYWITSLYLSFISFLASWYFVITFTQLFPKSKKVSLISFLFIPSIVFWSSGILKDTLSSAALIFTVAVMIKGFYLKRSSVLELGAGLIAVFVLLQVKHYLLISLILFSAVFIALFILLSIKGKMKWIIAIGVVTIAFISTQYIHPYLTWDRLPHTILEINETVLANTETNHSLIEIEEPTWNSILSASPKSLFTGLFRPSIFDSTIAFGWIHRIENLVLLILTILSLLLWIKEKPKIDVRLLLPSIISICMLATLLALTTPNFGTLVRYKNAFMPFLFLIVSILPYECLSSKTKE